MNKLIAVYGTLRKGEVNHYILEDSEFISEQIIPGFRMYGDHDYPAVLSAEDTEYITVEIYRVKSPQVAKAIDYLEAYNREEPDSVLNYYTLKSINIDSISEPVEIYTFDHTPDRVGERGALVLSGDWLKR